MTDLHTVEKPEYQIESTETELDQDELVWQAKIDELFGQIMSWLTPLGYQYQILIVSMDDFVDDNDSEDEIILPLLRSKSILRITFSEDDYAEFLPLGPYVMGENYEEYFAQVDLEIGEYNFIIAMKDKQSSWEIAEYLGFDKPRSFYSLNQEQLKMILKKFEETYL